MLEHCSKYLVSPGQQLSTCGCWKPSISLTVQICCSHWEVLEIHNAKRQIHYTRHTWNKGSRKPRQTSEIKRANEMYLVCPFKFIISKTNANCMRLGKHFGSPKEVSRLLFILGGGCPSSIMPQSSKELPYSHCPKKRVTKAVRTRRKAITYSGRQITRSPLLVPYANPRPGSGSQRAEFMLTCLLWSAGIGYRTLKTL